MESVETLIVGAGITGLATAAELTGGDYLVLEADDQIGGYCKTIHKDGFVWDYSGHFFHFKHPEIESWLRQRMGEQKVRVVEKRSFISYAGRSIDFPFQKNIHQLPKDELVDCLHDLYFARAPTELTGQAAATATAHVRGDAVRAVRAVDRGEVPDSRTTRNSTPATSTGWTRTPWGGSSRTRISRTSSAT